MTDRTQTRTPPIASHRTGWWTGDVWRVVPMLKKYRPDLRILCLDASPTGLILVSNLNPKNDTLSQRYSGIVEEMMNMQLDTITVSGFFSQVGVVSTATYSEHGAMVKAIHQ